MDLGIISTRYAKALLTYAIEKHEEDKAYAEMTTLAHSFAYEPRLRAALQNPTLKDEQKESLLRSASISNDAKLSEATSRFLTLVVKRGRADVMQFIANAYVTRYCQHKKIVRASLTLPTAIDDKLTARLSEFVEKRSGSKVNFEVKVDENIGGGFVLRYDTYQLDASLRTQFEKLHRELTR